MNYGQQTQFSPLPQSYSISYFQFYPGESVGYQQSSISFTNPGSIHRQQQPMTCSQPPISYTPHNVTYSQQPMTFPSQPVTFPSQPQTYSPSSVHYGGRGIQQNVPYTATGQPVPFSYVGNQTCMGMGGVAEPLMMQYSPTVKAKMSSSPDKDVYELKKAFDGIGCDSKVVNDILNYRSSSQLAEICKEYAKQVGRPLWKRIRDELYDPHRYLMIIVVHPPLVAEAFMLNRASTGYDIDVDTVAYVLATHTDREIAQIKDEHQKIYGKNIRDHLHGYSSGWCQNAWMALLEMRNMNDIDQETAHRQASLLYAPGSINEELSNHMIAVFCKSSPRSMIKVLKEYEKISGRKLYDVFVQTRPFEKTIASIVSYIEDPAKYFATYLHESILEKKLEKVINVIGTHYQVDLGVISSTYTYLFKATLQDDININFKSQQRTVEALMAHLGL